MINGLFRTMDQCVRSHFPEGSVLSTPKNDVLGVAAYYRNDKGRFARVVGAYTDNGFDQPTSFLINSTPVEGQEDIRIRAARENFRFRCVNAQYAYLPNARGRAWKDVMKRKKLSLKKVAEGLASQFGIDEMQVNQIFEIPEDRIQRAVADYLQEKLGG